MSERDRAIEILRQAREELVQRLCERIVHCEEEILEDATGYSFAGEIESLYDQLGNKLSNVNAMLSALQPGVDRGSFSVVTETHPMAAYETSFIQADTGDVSSATAARHFEAVHSAAERGSLDAFVRLAVCGEVDAATRMLATLLGIGEERARTLTGVFQERAAALPEIAQRTAALHRELQAGSAGGLQAWLNECFALQGAELTSIAQTLRERLQG